MKIVVVKFLDVITMSGWATIEEVDKQQAPIRFAAGWLLEETKKLVKVGLI